MFANVENDIVLSSSSHSFGGAIEIPENLRHERTSLLRFDGTKITSIKGYSAFYISGDGTKHIVKHKKKWTLLSCRYDEVLIYHNDQWRIKVELDVLKDAKNDAFDEIKTFANNARKLIAGSADHYQTAGWADKRARAMRIKLNTPEIDDIEIVQHEATKRGKKETVAELVDVQLAKAKKFAIATYDIDGMQTSAEDRVTSVTDIAEITVLLTALKSEAEQQITILTT